MFHPDAPTPGTTPTATPYTPAHEEMCPNGPHLVCRDYNAMPQRMWRTEVPRVCWRLGFLHSGVSARTFWLSVIGLCR